MEVKYVDVLGPPLPFPAVGPELIELRRLLTKGMQRIEVVS